MLLPEPWGRLNPDTDLQAGQLETSTQPKAEVSEHSQLPPTVGWLPKIPGVFLPSWHPAPAAEQP